MTVTRHLVNEVVETEQRQVIGGTTMLVPTRKVPSAQTAAKVVTEVAEDVPTALQAPGQCCSTSCSNGSGTANKRAKLTRGEAEVVAATRAETVRWSHHRQKRKPRSKTMARGGGGSQIGSGLRCLLRKVHLRKVPSALPLPLF